MRLNGVASIDSADPLANAIQEAQLVVRVVVSEVFSNCPRYIHKMQTVERSVYVPREGCQTPAPDWKLNEWVQDVLPGSV